jgi:hypothetical protein
VLSLDTLTDVTPSDKESYLSLHLGASGMDRIRGIMSLLQNKLL